MSVVKEFSGRKIRIVNSFFRPTTVKEALSLASDRPGKCVYFGGGTDLLIYRKHKLVNEETIIDLSELVDTSAFEVDKNSLRLGAAITLDDIATCSEIKNHFPILIEAAKSVATPVIRKTATLGGNLLVNNRCTFYNQSQEWRDAIGSCMRDVGDICLVTGGKGKCFSRNVSDTAPALIALGATVKIQSQKGKKQINLKDIYVPDGINFHQHLGDNAILTDIQVSEKPASWWFRKLRLRKTLDFTSLTVAATVNSSGVARVCLNGVSMSPVLIEESLVDLTLESLVKVARKNCKTVNNDLMPLKYRRQMIDLFLRDWWKSIDLSLPKNK